MFTKILGFGFLWYLFGNPIVALIVLLIILYIVDRRFIGLTPSLLRPIKIRRNIARFRQDLAANPHNASAKLELARLLIEIKNYKEAGDLLEDTRSRVPDSADLHADLGLCRLKLGDKAEGEKLMLRAVELNPRVKYGEPFLRLAEAFAQEEPQKAMDYLRQFRSVNSSSCEAYYRLGQLYMILGSQADAKTAFRETSQLYRTLPKYSRKQQRKWALLAKLKGG